MHACIQPPLCFSSEGREREKGGDSSVMYHVVEVHERVVDGDDLDIGVVHGGAQHNAANAAKAVESERMRAERDSRQ